MTSPTGNAPPSHGVEAGYSKDYGAEEKLKLYSTLDNTEYNATGGQGAPTYGSAAQPESTASVNPPFTQQQHQENVTNPFAKN